MRRKMIQVKKALFSANLEQLCFIQTTVMLAEKEDILTDCNPITEM